jgi:para-nitrobenzyl esterase
MWVGEFNATGQARVNSCAQRGTGSQLQASSTSEDCLYLTVYVPEREPANAAALPVVFYVTGGAYIDGYPTQTDGSKFASLNGGAVVVMAAYRLGIFGFLGADELRARDPRGSTGNYGLQDQQAALRWV